MRLTLLLLFFTPYLNPLSNDRLFFMYVTKADYLLQTKKHYAFRNALILCII